MKLGQNPEGDGASVANCQELKTTFFYFWFVHPEYLDTSVEFLFIMGEST